MYTYTCMCRYAYMHKHVCMYTCISIYVCMYAHKYTQVRESMLSRDSSRQRPALLYDGIILKTRDFDANLGENLRETETVRVVGTVVCTCVCVCVCLSVSVCSARPQVSKTQSKSTADRCRAAPRDCAKACPSSP